MFGKHVFFWQIPSSQRTTSDHVNASQVFPTQNSTQTQQLPDQSISSSSTNDPPNESEIIHGIKSTQDSIMDENDFDAEIDK